MGNDHSVETRNMVDSFSSMQIDDATRQIINRQVSSFSRLPLLFHTIHGSNITLLNNRKTAKRSESFCKGLAFSSRAIDVGENVCIRLTEVGCNWSGVLRFGISNIDPEVFRNVPVPKFACPDLTTKEGYWAKALPERYSVQGNILHFFVNEHGELYYGLNGRQKGLFLTGINTAAPMWIILDIYGNSITIDFLEPSEFTALSQNTPSVTSSARSTPAITSSIPPALNTQTPSVVSSSVNSPSSRPVNVPQRRMRTSPILRIEHTGPALEPVRFHAVTGRYLTLDASRLIATRNSGEYIQGYVFTSRPIKNNEVVSVTVKDVELRYEGGLAFGVTCCNPAELCRTDLPDDSSDLIEMPQYWVGIKDIAVQPSVNTTLKFWITEQGEVKFQRVGSSPRTALHVDNSLDLYMWFDVYGTTTSIKLNPVEMVPIVIPIDELRALQASGVSLAEATRDFDSITRSATSGLRVNVGSSSTNDLARTSIDELLGDGLPQRSFEEPVPPRRRVVLPPPATRTFHDVGASSSARITSAGGSSTSANMPRRAIPPQARASVQPPPPRPAPPVPSARTQKQKSEEPEKNSEGECLVCFDSTITSVLYGCGHACMCYECAQHVKETTGTCPICRLEIRDVIRFYRA